MIMWKPATDITGLSPLMRVAIRHIHEIHQKYQSDMIITSGYRSTMYNKTVGGHPNSKHLYGLAIDIRTRHLPDPKLIFQEIKTTISRFGYKVILENDHIHIEYQEECYD